MSDTMHDLPGMVFDIQKFSIHDGPGIRTTVFLKGCPLDCQWCHNPESKRGRPEISWIPDKCVGCGFCVATCLEQCHSLDAEGLHRYDRANCRRCGACVADCYAKALEVVGREMCAADVIAEVLKDVPFYETSGGGMTISGGEPMAQFEFTLELLRLAKQNGLHTCLETSGFAPGERYQTIAPLVDIFLYDCKETDPQKHLEFTGVPREPIVDNLHLLDGLGAAIILRCPIIPGINDRADHLQAIADIANQLENIVEVNLLPYHPLGKSKSLRVGLAYRLTDDRFPAEEQVNRWLACIRRSTSVPVRK